MQAAAPHARQFRDIVRSLASRRKVLPLTCFVATAVPGAANGAKNAENVAIRPVAGCPVVSICGSGRPMGRCFPRLSVDGWSFGRQLNRRPALETRPRAAPAREERRAEVKREHT